MAYRFFCKLELTEYPQSTRAETLDRVWLEYVDSILAGSVYQIHSDGTVDCVYLLQQLVHEDYCTLDRRIESSEGCFAWTGFIPAGREQNEEFKRAGCPGTAFSLRSTRGEKLSDGYGARHWLACEGSLYPIQTVYHYADESKGIEKLTVYSQKPSIQNGTLRFLPLATITQTRSEKNRWWEYNIWMDGETSDRFSTAVCSLILSIFQDGRPVM